MPIQNKSARRRHIRRHGNDVTLVRSIETGETDAYGDPTFTEETEETHALVKLAKTTGDEFNFDTGEHVEYPVIVHLPDTVGVPAEEDTKRWARIEDHTSQQVYLIKHRFRSPDGVIRCYCSTE